MGAECLPFHGCTSFFPREIQNPQCSRIPSSKDSLLSLHVGVFSALIRRGAVDMCAVMRIRKATEVCYTCWCANRANKPACLKWIRQLVLYWLGICDWFAFLFALRIQRCAAGKKDCNTEREAEAEKQKGGAARLFLSRSLFAQLLMLVRISLSLSSIANIIPCPAAK